MWTEMLPETAPRWAQEEEVSTPGEDHGDIWEMRVSEERASKAAETQGFSWSFSEQGRWLRARTKMASGCRRDGSRCA